MSPNPAVKQKQQYKFTFSKQNKKSRIGMVDNLMLPGKAELIHASKLHAQNHVC